MQLSTVAGVVLAVLVLTGSAAALPANAPAQADDHASDQSDAADRTDAASAEADNATSESDDATGEAGDAGDARRGPPTDLPAQAPDFVSGIHDAVRDHLAGDGDGSLGDRVSDLTPGGDEQSDASDRSGDAGQPPANATAP